MLAILPRHIETVRHLDCSHADPFDRLLIAQARDERLTLLTRDAAMLGLRLDCIDAGWTENHPALKRRDTASRFYCGLHALIPRVTGRLSNLPPSRNPRSSVSILFAWRFAAMAR